MQRITPTVSRRARQLLVSLSLVGATVAAVAATVGQQAPALELPGAQGTVSLAAAKGKVVYVDFWASWCGPCRQSFPWMNEMQAKYGPRGLQIIGVNLDAKREDADKFLAQTPAKFTLAFDSKGDTPRAYGVKGMPTSVLVGADGKVIDHHSGFHDEERKALEDAIVAALVKAGR
jgi:thiol-disulfide isomerase/thioredoxin